MATSLRSHDRPDVHIRTREPTDPVPGLTALLHRAYASLAARGMHFVATHQGDEVTRRRIAEGTCLVAVDGDDTIIGTIVVVTPGDAGHDDDEQAFYARPEVARFGQLAVEPRHQGRGLGRQLVEAAEKRAREAGATWLALDTSERAGDLIAFYARQGYATVDRHRWQEVNYESLIMAKRVDEATLANAVAIRPARLDDAPAMHAINVGAIRVGCRDHYPADEIAAWAGSKAVVLKRRLAERPNVFVAEEDGAVVAFGGASTDPPEIGTLFVQPDRTGRGLGSRVLGALEDGLLRAGASSIRVHASLNAVPFYARHGYEDRGPEVRTLTEGVRLASRRMEKKRGERD